MEGVDELDWRQPQSTHLALHVLTHVRKIAILSPDQVCPVACGDIGLCLGSSLVTDGRRLRRRLRNAVPSGERGQENERYCSGKIATNHCYALSQTGWRDDLI